MTGGISLAERMLDVALASDQLSNAAVEWLDAKAAGVKSESADARLDRALLEHRRALRRLERTRKRTAPADSLSGEPSLASCAQSTVSRASSLPGERDASSSLLTPETHAR